MTAIGLTLCRHQCSEESIGTLWPKPSGATAVSKSVVKIDPEKISFKTNSFKKEPEMWEMAEERFNDMIVRKLGRKYSLKSGGEGVVVEVIAETDDMCEKIILLGCSVHLLRPPSDFPPTRRVCPPPPYLPALLQACLRVNGRSLNIFLDSKII